MDEAELRRRLAGILAEEEETQPDWDRVEALCLDLNLALTGAAAAGCPEIVGHFLDDADIRRRDERYAEGQRERVRVYVETGRVPKSDAGMAVPPWGAGSSLRQSAQWVFGWQASSASPFPTCSKKHFPTPP